MKLTWKNMNWLWVAGVLTAGYAALIILTLGWTRIAAFLTTEPDLNAIGDFLAGVFAPVALIWLVAAVLTQRQELNETREQFTENQKVVDAQLNTINSQNSLLTLQHNQAVERDKKAYKLSLFDKRFAIYERFINFGEDHRKKEYDEDSYRIMTNLAKESGFVFDRSMEEWLESIADQIADYIQFKQLNPLERHGDVYGRITYLDTETNRELQSRYSQFTAWISEQFTPPERDEMFWHFLHVSDEPYMAG